MPRRHTASVRRATRIVLGTMLAFGLTACFPEVTPAPPTSGAAITVSKTENVEAGDVITISGTGFTTTGNLGTRPPLAGQPAGVYVVFGRFAENWKPSAGAGGRTVIVQKWALNASSRDILVGFPWLQDPAQFVTYNADGSWSTTITVPSIDTSQTDFGFAVYPGSGASNTGEELLQRVTVGTVAVA
ncbi:MAG TPA: hypothetical protein PLV93_09925 [Microthrixaceae bacterium]|nr:hypothetical protein [Microthrixaceae bacterium]HNI35707.1 hypothetical protein [Microthrixaceae bacterium]